MAQLTRLEKLERQLHSDEQKAIEAFLKDPLPYNGACGCMGPQNGQPLCPCGMKWCREVNGVWYQIIQTGNIATPFEANKVS